MAFKLFLKQKVIVLMEMGRAESSLRSTLAYDVFCLPACCVGVSIIFAAKK